MKSTIGGQWRTSGRSRGPRTALARIATSLVLATASFSVAALGATSLASAAGAPRHSAAGTLRHSAAGTPGHRIAGATRHRTAGATRHRTAGATRHRTAGTPRHRTAGTARHRTADTGRHTTAGAPLSCDGGTIYSYQRGTKGSDPATTGSVYALNTSTVGGSTVAATLVTKVPSGGFANALGITKGGTGMYAVNQTTSKASSAVIHGYSASTQTWTRYTGSSGASDSFVAGAVNPATNIYYYVTYGTGSSSKPGTGTVYGFNTDTNTRITGVIATFSLPSGNSSAGNNGDIAFDSAGNMYVLASNGSAVGIGVVKGPIPTTGSSSGAPLTDTLLNRFADSNSYNGIAFDNSGNLYVSGIRGSTSVLTKLNPNTGAVIAGPTPLSSNAQAFANVDLAACSLNPTLSLRKDIVARYAPGDQFTLSITGGGIREGNTTTTTGNTTGVQREVAGPVIARSGTTYKLDETAASGSLLNYATTYSCVDTANGNAPVASGAGASITLPFPGTTVVSSTTLPSGATAGVSPNVVCTFTNAPLRPGITLHKSVAEDTLTVGETLHYSFLVTNTGNVTLAPVTINDTEFTGHGTRPVVTCPAGAADLAPAASVTCTATYAVTQADVDAGSVSNTATASGKTPASQAITSPPSSATVRGGRSPAITVVKSASPSTFSVAGETINYSFDVTNSGNVTLTSVKVDDHGLPGLSAITCPHTTLAAGASQTCTATYLTTAADVDAGSVTNTATAKGDPPTGPHVVSAPSSATITAIQSPAITVVKSASPSTFSVAGETINYSFDVTNSGNVTLTSVKVDDHGLPGLSAITCPHTTLAAGASQTCTATYLTTAADVDAGSVTNTATAKGDPPTGPHVVSAPSSATITAIQSPAITVVKSASPSTFSVAGETINYSFDVTNSGNVTLTSVKVDDHGLPGLSAITCPHTTLAAGASQTCTATYLTTAADVDAGSVTNTATAKGDPPTGPHVVSAPSSATITAIQSPAITVVKSASPSTFSVAGETINYSFDVTNSGNVTLTSVKVDDHGLPGLSAITCPHTTLAAGASQTCTATYLTTAADVDAGSVTNTATAKGDPPTGPHVVSAPSSATITAIQSPAITVVKSASPSTFSVAGETINYSFDVTNSGNVTLTSVKVDDHGLPGLSAITCPHTTLAAGASQTCTATYLTTAADVDAGSVTNTATAKGDPPTGPHVVSAPSSATITAIQSPAITVVKSASPSTFSVAGETINYSFDVTNSGNVTLTSVKVDDHGLPGLSAITCPHTTLAAGASQTCTATYLTTAADVDAGSVTNTATAKGDPPTGPHVVSAPSSATITAIHAPAVTVVKSASPTSFSAAGQTIHYSFDVTNSGNVTLTSVQVNDTDLPGLSAITCPHTTLAAGASQTCTATYLTTAADVDAGSVTNTATARGKPPTGPHVVSAPSSATITAIHAPAVTVVKSASPTSFSAAGQTIHYSFDVTNSGNVTLTSVQVNDTDLPGLSAITCPHTTLAAGASQTCTATYLTTAADVDAGSVTNHATAQGDPPTGPPVVSAPSAVTITLILPPIVPVTG